MTTPDRQPTKRTESTPTGSGIPRSQDQAMVMTRMLMRWKPGLGLLRGRRRHQTHVSVNVAAAVDESDDASREAEAAQRQARAEQSAHRFVGLSETNARVLADELDLTVRFFRRGESLREDARPGRVTAQLEDGVVVAARAMH